MADKTRSVVHLQRPTDTAEGAGVRIKRAIGTPQLDNLDPFLLFDEINSEQGADYIAGFPDHPHRGFETVTYMLAGHMQHGDHKGNRGDLSPGSVQWMTAGRGIIHSEMPQQTDGMLWGFQIWVNLPASDKMIDPRYQDIEPELVPEITDETGGMVRVVAGEYAGASGPITGIATDPMVFDVRLQSGGRFEHPLRDGYTAFCYVYDGAGTIGEGGSEQAVQAKVLAILSSDGKVQIQAGEKSLGLLLLCGRPLHEPIARYGPFVMNTQEEIMQAFEDYQSGRLAI